MGIIKSLGTIDRAFNKDEIIALAQADAQTVAEDDKYDLLKVYVEMKRYELYLHTVMEQIKAGALGKALETGEKSISITNAKVTIMERRVFHFDNDLKWQSLNGNLEYWKNQKKEREKLLKNIAPGNSLTVVDAETGEVEELTAPTQEVVKGMIVKF